MWAFLRQFIIIIFTFFVGILIGGYLFSGVEPRSFIKFNNCEDKCLTSKEFAGLAASVGVQKFGKVLPLIVEETDKTIAFQHPFPEARVHYIVVPKIDIKNIGEIGEGDEQYLVDSFAVISRLVEKEKLTQYKIITNGPGYQTVAYLHFHLVAK